MTQSPPTVEPPEVAASRMVSVHRCPGYAVNGSGARCHTNEEPGGYDVLLGMIVLNQKPMPLEDAVEYARAVARWVGVAIDYDRRGVMAKQAGDPLPATITPSMFGHSVGPLGTKVLKALKASKTGRLVSTLSIPRGLDRHPVGNHPMWFVIEGSAVEVPWDMVMFMEREGMVQREPWTDRSDGPRVITERGRRAAVARPSRKPKR